MKQRSPTNRVIQVFRTGQLKFIAFFLFAVIQAGFFAAPAKAAYEQTAYWVQSTTDIANTDSPYYTDYASLWAAATQYVGKSFTCNDNGVHFGPPIDKYTCIYRLFPSPDPYVIGLPSPAEGFIGDVPSPDTWHPSCFYCWPTKWVPRNSLGQYWGNFYVRVWEQEISYNAEIYDNGKLVGNSAICCGNYWSGFRYVLYKGEIFCRPPLTYNPTDHNCEQANNYTLTLSRASSIEPWNQSHDPNHSTATESFTATVRDQNGQGKAGIGVTITSVAVPYSGGHEHDNNRPPGWLGTSVADIGNQIQANLNAGATQSAMQGSGTISGQTDSNGVFSFTFGAEEAAGTHTLTAKCSQCTNSPQTASIVVKVNGLEPIPAMPLIYTLQAKNPDTNHPDTHYLTDPAILRLQTIAAIYWAKTWNQPKKVTPDFFLNDSSLAWGGVLDCFLTCKNSTPWHPSHKEHRRGTVVDIRTGGADNAIQYLQKFIEIAMRQGADPHPEGTNGQHIHLRIMHKAE